MTYKKTSNINSGNQSNYVYFKALSLLNLIKINTRIVFIPSVAQPAQLSTRTWQSIVKYSPTERQKVKTNKEASKVFILLGVAGEQKIEFEE